MCILFALDCYRKRDKGHSYRGNISTTVNGRTCQRWDVETPFNPLPKNKNSSNHPDGNINHNYCRNPKESLQVKPWCYTTDPEKRFETCDVPLCGSSKYIVICNQLY